MSNTEITTAQYVTNRTGANSSICATINGQEMFVPFDLGNRHYAEIMRQVEAGELTIQEAD